MGPVAARMDGAREALRRVFGFEGFRGVQADVVDRVLAGRSTLAVMPTGAGKSLTYQLPATILPGTCVVISPLIALMHDQLRSARANGISAATLIGNRARSAKISPRSTAPCWRYAAGRTAIRTSCRACLSICPDPSLASLVRGRMPIPVVARRVR